MDYVWYMGYLSAISDQSFKGRDFKSLQIAVMICCFMEQYLFVDVF